MVSPAREMGGGFYTHGCRCELLALSRRTMPNIQRGFAACRRQGHDLSALPQGTRRCHLSLSKDKVIKDSVKDSCVDNYVLYRIVMETGQWSEPIASG